LRSGPHFFLATVVYAIGFIGNLPTMGRRAPRHR